MIFQKEKKKMMILFILIMLIILGLIFIRLPKSHKEEDKKISLIVYGNDVNRWENLRQGAELAAGEDGAEVSLITMSNENGVDEQIRIIEREIKNGADALLIAACDSKRIGEYIDNSKIKIPVTFVETGVDSSKTRSLISANDYQMGYELGNRIRLNENYIVKVAIVSDGTIRNSIKERERGLRDALGDGVKYIVTWERNENEKDINARLFLQRELVSEAVDVVVTLDNTNTDALIDALSNLNKTTKVYSISTSDKSVYSLDQKKIKELTYQTEFGIGYIGVKYALDEKRAKKQYGNEDVQYRVVNKDNMYDYDNQTLLFPFVK